MRIMNTKALLKRKTEILNRIVKLQKEISILEREHREIVNNLDLNRKEKPLDEYYK